MARIENAPYSPTHAACFSGAARSLAARVLRDAYRVDVARYRHRGAVSREKAQARNVYRHPKETLEFFGVAPTQSVLEIAPGGGWYTDILAPYLRGRGTL